MGRALGRVADHAVFDAVQSVAGFARGLAEQLERLGGQRVLRLQARAADHPGHELLEAEGRRSGEHAVVVVREAGRLQHRRAAAIRAALDVRVVDLPAVVVLDRPLGGPGRKMDAAIGVVEQGLGLPHVVAVLAFVPSVGGGHREAAAEQARRVADEARGAADGAEHHPAVPDVGERDLEADRPVDDAAHPAVGWHTFRGGHPEPRLDRVVEVGQGDQAAAIAAGVVRGKRRCGNKEEQHGRSEAPPGRRTRPAERGKEVGTPW